MTKKFYTVTEAAARLNVTRPTVYAWLKSGRLSPLYLNGAEDARSMRVEAGSVDVLTVPSCKAAAIRALHGQLFEDLREVAAAEDLQRARAINALPITVSELAAVENVAELAEKLHALELHDAGHKAAHIAELK
jgi:hypothetical protein